MRQKHIVTTLVILVCLFFSFSCANSKDISSVVFIEKVIAESTDYTIEEYWKDPSAVQIGKSWYYYSEDKELAIYFANKSKTLIVRAGDVENAITLKGNTYEIFNFIVWRPGSSSFVYSKYEEDDDGGDIGSCSIHYVNVHKVNGQIELSEKTLIPYNFDTDFAWSNDGKYFAYIDGFSIRIHNFETGKEWVTKEVCYSTGGCIYPGFNMIGLKWIDNDKKIFILFKDSPQSEVRYTAEIDIEQFHLE